MKHVKTIQRELRIHNNLYLMLVPVIVYYVLFHYAPMYGMSIAFKDYSPMLGITGSPWVGLKNFDLFFGGIYFGRIFSNTLIISGYQLLFGFPAPILLALLLNELRTHTRLKRTLQTATYMPYFISTVVMCGMIVEFTSSRGIISQLVSGFGEKPTNLLIKASNFRAIYVISGVWQHLGWDSIIYLAALSSLDQELYESAYIDGAGRFRQMLHITLPGLSPTIIILLVLRIGNVMNLGYEKIILLYAPATYKTADVISSYVYRKGLLEQDFSYSAAVGMFNSVINYALLIGVNALSRKLNETSLW